MATCQVTVNVSLLMVIETVVGALTFFEALLVLLEKAVAFSIPHQPVFDTGTFMPAISIQDSNVK